MNQRITNFINQNTVFTMATSVGNFPYCANCFYVFDSIKKYLIFLSDDTTRHINEALLNKNVAGTINNGNTVVAKIQGVQFTGVFINPDKEEQVLFYETYYKKFPFAKEHTSKVWAIKLNTVKMTDNTLVFGEKIKWES